jgi:hypothetical protein
MIARSVTYDQLHGGLMPVVVESRIHGFQYRHRFPDINPPHRDSAKLGAVLQHQDRCSASEVGLQQFHWLDLALRQSIGKVQRRDIGNRVRDVIQDLVEMRDALLPWYSPDDPEIRLGSRYGNWQVFQIMLQCAIEVIHSASPSRRQARRQDKLGFSAITVNPASPS